MFMMMMKILYATAEPMDICLIKQMQIFDCKGWTQNSNSHIRVVLKTVVGFLEELHIQRDSMLPHHIVEMRSIFLINILYTIFFSS